VIVIDASVLANALTDDGQIGARARAALAEDLHWAAPEHLTVELFSAIRGRYLGRKISEQRAADAVEAVAAMTIDTLATAPLLARIWQLRANLTGYDAAYVAAAELYECALVTADERLSHAPDLRCELRLA